MKKIDLRRFLILSFWVIVCYSSAMAQRPKAEHISVNDGLPNSTITTIAKDDIGFMWFGTKNGLAKYDGENFTNYLPNPRKDNALPDGYIFSLFQDTDHNIYIGTYNGYFCRYNYNQGELEQLFSLDTIFFKSTPISKIIRLDRQNLLIATLGEGLLKYSPQDKILSKIQIDNKSNKSIKYISDMLIQQNEIWISTNDNFVYCYDKNIRLKRTIEIPISNEYDFMSFGNKLLINDNIIYVGTENNGCFATNINSDKFYHIPQTRNYHISAIEYANDILYIATDGNGILYEDHLNNNWNQILYNPEDIYSISGNAIWSLKATNDNILWIGTFARGINYLTFGQQMFKDYRYISNCNESVTAPSVLSILQDHNNKIWFGTDGGGLDSYTNKTNTFTNFNTSNSTLTSNVIKSIYEDDENTIWLGTYADGISFLDNKKYIQHNKIVERLKSISIWDITQDNNGIYWFATLYQGLFSYNSKTQEINNYRSNPNDSTSLAHNILNVVYTDSKGNLWIGTDGGGLSRFDSQTNSFVNHKYSKERTNSLGSDVVLTIFEDSEKRLWIGTKNGGLNLLKDEKNSEFIQYTTDNGLTSNTINSIIEDHTGRLWLSSDKGLMKFSPATHEVESYSTINGLQTNEFNYEAAIKTSDNIIIWGALNGFNTYCDQTTKTDSIKLSLNIIINEIYIDDKPIGIYSDKIQKAQNGTCFDIEELKLSENIHSIGFDFIGFNYSNIEQKDIYYRLIGEHNEWIHLKEGQSNVAYQNLKGGKYTFEYKIKDNKGFESKVKQMRLIIPQRIWENVFFYISIFILAILILFLGFMSIIKVKNRRALELEKKIEERTSIISRQNEELTKQRDDLQASNSKILLQQQELLKSQDELNQQNEELKTTSQMLHDVNEEILAQNLKISEQTLALKNKNQLITKSLNYARRIQDTIFPNEITIRKILPHSFIFFKAKDIVSGDFYWMREINNKIIFSEVDCTGHGVPGAFMSMIGNTLLNEIILNQKITDADLILYRLNEHLLNIFSLGNFDLEAQDDGMDMTLGVYDKATNKLQIVSAMQNFYIVQNNNIQAYNGDIFSIGGLMAKFKKPVYTLHEFDVKQGMRIYFSSDGYIDQFGEMYKTKYGVERFEKLLLSLNPIRIEEQKQCLENDFKEWTKDCDQLDDVLVIGIEF